MVLLSNVNVCLSIATTRKWFQNGAEYVKQLAGLFISKLIFLDKRGKNIILNKHNSLIKLKYVPF